ncbi:MAG: penicillin-binding protein 2 [Kiritimatiellia bacterium]
MKAIRTAGARLDAERLRFAILGVVMLLGLLNLLASLHRIQVVDAGLYSDAQDATSFRRVRQPATRGRILDRNGVVLADNRPSYCVAFYIEELRESGPWSNTVNRVDALLDEVSAIVGKPREVERDGIWNHLHRRRAIPLFAFKGLNEQQMARLAEWPGALPGTEIHTLAERFYPHHDLACHIIGYVGSGQPHEAREEDGLSEENEDYNFYLPDLAGRDGVELACDADLAGRGGGHLIRVNAVGYKHEVIPGRPPVPGRDIVLTIDADLQAEAEAALGDNRGAALVLDCTSGDLLVAATAPRYDLMAFVPSLPNALWRRLLADPSRPLVNRALSGIYPPGSIFKPVVALSALREGVVDPDAIYTCVGSIRVGPRTIRCSSRYGHGDLSMRRAIAVSCNPYFISMGMKLGYEPRLHDDCAMMGFGQAPSIGIPVAEGILPSTAWKRRRMREGWRGGDTANIAIGQGLLSVTPLQAVVMVATIGLDGRVPKPRLLRDRGDGAGVQERLELSGRVDWRPRDLAIVKAGMEDVVHAPHGTGRRAAIRSVRAAGKTGTAEYYENGERKKHAWFALFAPVEQPRYAMVVVAEDSDAGGQTAARIAHRILAKLHGEEPVEPKPVVVEESIPEEPGPDDVGILFENADGETAEGEGE